ncbi:hypothetical protein Dimus_003844 [Dionaea muscipula]
MLNTAHSSTIPPKPQAGLASLRDQQIKADDRAGDGFGTYPSSLKQPPRIPSVLGNEHRVKLYGRGVTASSIRKTSSGNESGGNSASVNVPDELLQKLTAQVTEQVTAVLADKFSLTMAYHLKQISPRYNVDPEALKRLLLTPGDASSAQIHQSPHVNTSSSVNANEASNQDDEDEDDEDEDDEEEDDEDEDDEDVDIDELH